MSASRRAEVEKHLREMGEVLPVSMVNRITASLELISTSKHGNCLDPGGSCVRGWIARHIPRVEIDSAKKADTTDHVVGVFHFWAWQEDLYGPPPKGPCGTNVDTMRSPTYRLIDAKPVNKTAYRVAGKQIKRIKK